MTQKTAWFMLHRIRLSEDWDHLRIDHFGRRGSDFTIAGSVAALDEQRAVHAIT